MAFYRCACRRGRVLRQRDAKLATRAHTVSQREIGTREIDTRTQMIRINNQHALIGLTLKGALGGRTPSSLADQGLASGGENKLRPG